ncbi:Transcriptional activator FeaR [Pseudomonas oleovorans subsp. oleovorans]|uniref:AraC family transcriptional regulator n=1 Tax=Ectopseudomonas oleovorans TaxID=301 RepID=A0A379JTK8_ECTOL|nr:AraC family transcriptional regulator [Pseudomonas oleovorans]OWK49282.1 Transcriptional activator FeaR [Pseudomonas oleovorans subsp. oleovorans]SUD51666.1 AraC family transcriptional regulator [Pseudomonas oleovorans]
MLLHEKSAVFERADPYAVSDYVNQHLGIHCIHMPKNRHSAASLSHRKFASLDLCRIRYGGQAQITSPALQSVYHLQVQLKGRSLWFDRGVEQQLQPGDLLMINPDDPVDLTYADDCEKLIIKLPTRLLEACCEEQRWSLPKEGVRFTRTLQRLEHLQDFMRLVDLICLESESDESGLQTQHHYTRIVANKLLTKVPNNIRRDAPPQHAVPFELLIQYIDEHLKNEPSIEQLAALAQVSQRSLYALFERHLNCTPKQYVRDRKLDRVHACLSDPSCHVRSVTEIALDYGFMHLSRFSENYKARFGELPSETFRRQSH